MGDEITLTKMETAVWREAGLDQLKRLAKHLLLDPTASAAVTRICGTGGRRLAGVSLIVLLPDSGYELEETGPSTQPLADFLKQAACLDKLVIRGRRIDADLKAPEAHEGIERGGNVPE